MPSSLFLPTTRMIDKNVAAGACPYQLRNRLANIALTFFAMAGVMITSSVEPAAGQPKPADQAVIQTPTINSAGGDQKTFRSRVHDEMADWKLKMQAFNEQTEARGKHQISVAEAALRRAWDNTEVKARNVQAASARGWERAKQSYETATGEMKKAWDKARG